MRQHIPFFILLLCVPVFLLLLIPFGPNTTPDSLAYFETAKHLQSGEGLVLTNYTSWPNTLAPMTVWPPLYPALLGALACLGMEIPVAAIMVSMLCLFFVLAVFYSLLQPVAGAWVATLASAALLSCIPTLVVFSHAWSEPVFWAVLMLATWCCVQHLASINTNQRSSRGYLLGMIVTLALLVWVRYIGVVFLLMLLPSIVQTRGRRSWWPVYVSGAMLYLLLVGVLLARNYYLSGFITGQARLPSDSGWVANIQSTIDVLSFYAGGWAVLVVFCVLLAWAALRKPCAAATGRPWVLLMLFLVLVYAGALVCLRSLRAFDPVDVRLLSPAWPLLLMATAFAIHAANRWVKAVWAGCMLVVILSGVSLLIANANWVANQGTIRLPANPGVFYANMSMADSVNTDLALAQFTTGQAPAGDWVMLTDRPRIVHFLTRGNMPVQQLHWERLCEQLPGIGDRYWIYVVNVDALRPLLPKELVLAHANQEWLQRNKVVFDKGFACPD